MVHGISPERITTGEAIAFLEHAGRSWGVVSCFSLLHHFALGRGTTDAVGLVQALDRATERVLFIDTGQSHEKWFRDSLPEWDTTFVQRFLRQHTSFDRIVDLGPDRDDRPPFSGNYGRHLFACVRES